MAFLGCASFDVYGTSDIEDDFISVGLGSIVAGAGRCSTDAFHGTAAIGSGPSAAVVPSGLGGWQGFAYNRDGTSSTQTWSVNKGDGTCLAFIRVLPNGAIQGWKGINTILGSVVCTTPPGLIHNNRYSAIGVDWLISTSGYLKIYVDGHLYANSGVVNMHTFYTSGQWGLLAWTVNGYIDDLFWGDQNTTNPLDAIAAYPGDAHVQGQLCQTDAIAGGGNFKEWSPSTGTDHGALLDENPPNDNTDYVSSGTVGQRESVKFPAILPASGSIFGIRHLPNAIKTTFATREVVVGTYVGGVESYQAAQALAQTNYRYYPSVHGYNPVAAAAWSVATANLEQALIKISS